MLEMFYILTFVIALVFTVLAISLPEGSNKILAMTFAGIMWFAVALSSYAVEKIYILEVNNTLVQHTIIVKDNGFAKLSWALGFVFIALSFLHSLAILKEGVEE